MGNWDSIRMAMNYMFCNDKITYSWAGMGKYIFGGIWVNILLSNTCQPRSQTLSPLPSSMTREAKKREPGIMVGYTYLFSVFFPGQISCSLSVPDLFDQWGPNALDEDLRLLNWDNKQAQCNVFIAATLKCPSGLKHTEVPVYFVLKINLLYVNLCNMKISHSNVDWSVAVIPSNSMCTVVSWNYIKYLAGAVNGT